MHPLTRTIVNLLPFKRRDIPYILGIGDREGRNAIRLAKEDGFPILSPEYGVSEYYRLADSPKEIEKCYTDMFNRAYSLMRTASAMKNRMQSEGQLKDEQV